MINKQHLLSALFYLFSFVASAQGYPFEKFKAIKFQEYKDWKTTENPKDSMPMQREITIPSFDKKVSLKIEQFLNADADGIPTFSKLKIYCNSKMVKEFDVKTQSIYTPLPVRIEDINGDGLKDIKIVFPNFANGGYNYYCDAVYLFQNKNGTFNEIMYTDIFEEYNNKPERDFNNDGQYEIITQTFQDYGKHNYWLFNIYNYKNGKLVNVNYLAGYPIMVPLNSSDVSKKIPRKTMKKYSIKIPKME